MEMSLICMRISNSFPFEWLSTRTRFETEACNNSEMGYCFGFALLHSVIGSEFLRHFFNQSEVKPKPIVACACTFSRALCRLRVITLSFDWFTGFFFRPFSLAKVITFKLVLVLRHSIETRRLYVKYGVLIEDSLQR